jgi:hypothetical protein
LCLLFINILEVKGLNKIFKKSIYLKLIKFINKMIIKKSKKPTKRGNESRRVREKGESTFENIDERDEDNLKKDNFQRRQISSEENNVSSSVDIEKLKIKKKKKGKGKKGKSKGKSENKQQEDIDKALIQLEKNNKEKMLKGELADLMEEIELENKDFKKNVFFSNFHDLNNNLGIFDEVEENKNQENNYSGLKSDPVTPFGLIDKYTEKAEKMKKIKKKK